MLLHGEMKMNAIKLQDMIFPKYQEFVEHNGHCPNTLLVGYRLSYTITSLLEEPNPTYAGMKVICCDKLEPTEFKLGILL